MRWWKHVLLLVGIVGVSAMFAPMLQVKQGRVALDFSARHLTFGLDRTYSLIDRELPKVAERYLPASVRQGREDVRLVARAARWAAAAYIPAALMVLLGAIGLYRGRFGRVLAMSALLCGLAAIGAWVGLTYGIDYALKEAGLARTEVSLLFGAHVLMVVGVIGALVGLGALVRPDRGRQRGGGGGGGWGPPYPPPTGGPPGSPPMGGPGSFGPPGPPPAGPAPWNPPA